MAEERPVQFADWVIAVVATVGVVVAMFSPVRCLFAQSASDPTNPLIRDSAVTPVFFWGLAWPAVALWRFMHIEVRLCWALGCALLWVHVAIAFHLGHGWSHRAAWEHTKQVGGYGDGIFVNYAFALVWLLDALWALTASASYHSRPRWLHWTVHGFIAFVVVNAAFVFASWGARVQFVLCGSLGGLALWYTRRRENGERGV
jgi:hypothetical protein